MSISVVCSGCDADYSVPDNLLGKTIRCKKCSETILVKRAAAARPVAAKVVEDDDEDRPRRAVRRDADDERPSRPAMRRRDEDDDEEYERPAKKSGISPLLIGSLAALLLVGTAGGVYYAMNSDGDKDTAGKQDPAPRVDPTRGRTPLPDPKDPPAEEKKEEPKKEDAKKEDPKKTEDSKADLKADDEKKDEKKAPEKKADEKKADNKDTKKDDGKGGAGGGFADRPVQGVASGRGGSESGIPYDKYVLGKMDPVTMAMVKKASVYIFAESAGGAGTGSGWFGIEPGLVFTNAHVLHMTAPNAPEPKQIKFYLNSGTTQQRLIPHSKIKILAVDREIDIAVLQVINEPDLPPPLKVRPSGECQEGLNLTTVGYPFGALPSMISGQSSHEPEVSLRPTTITSFRHNDYGQIRRVQLEGGANPGNSGGPVVDAEGTVCTVIVEGVHGGGGGPTGIALTMGVPTEYCFGILAGRIAETTPEIAYKDGDKVRIPIKIKCLDPLNRLKSVGVAAWIGNPSDKYRSPGLSKPKEEAGDRDYQEIALKYDNKTKMATGELVMPAKPDGTVYWIQPFYSNPIVTRYWQPGLVYKRTNEPADRIVANLAYKNEAGKSRVVTMSTASTKGEEAEGEGAAKAQRRLIRFGLTVSEEVQGPDNSDSVQGGKLRLKFLNLAMPQVVTGNRGQDGLPKILFARLNEEVKKCGAVALVNKEGVVYKHAINTVNLQQPIDKFYISWFTNSAMDSLEATSIKMPNKQVNPGETWDHTKDFEVILQDPPPTDDEGRQIPGTKIPEPRKYRYQESRIYKYVGIRIREGRKEAMIQIEGKMTKAPGATYGASGSVIGFAAVEVDTGVVIDCVLEKDFEIDTSSKGVKKNAFGVMVYRINRSAPN